MKQRIRHIAATAAAIVLAAATEAYAQIRVIDRSVLDSIANPPTAPRAAETMRFAETAMSTGTISEDDAPSAYRYRFRNEGSEPLAITRITTSCGCTEALAEPKIVAAGGEGEIRVIYRPKGHAGRFTRKVFVYTQLSERQPTAVLTLNADVTAGSDTDGEYMHRMGALRLKRNSLTFSRGESGSESIEVWNAGDRELTIECRRQLLPECVKFECEPQRLAPNGKACITIRYDAAAFPAGRKSLAVPLMLTGTGDSVMQSTVRVTVE